MVTSNGTAIAGGALGLAMIDLLVSKGLLERSEVGNLVAAAIDRLGPLPPSADIESARATLSSLAYMYSGAGRNG